MHRFVLPLLLCLTGCSVTTGGIPPHTGTPHPPPIRRPATPPMEAAHGTVQMVVAGPTVVGETFEVELHAEVGQDHLAAYAFSLAFDPRFVALDAVTAGRSGLGNPMAVNLDPTIGELRFNGLSVYRVASGRVHVATLQARVQALPPGGVTVLKPIFRGGETLAVYTANSGTGAVELDGWSMEPLHLRITGY